MTSNPEGKDELGYYFRTKNARHYHNICLDCKIQFDCHKNLVKHREIIHDDYSGQGGTICKLECTS